MGHSPKTSSKFEVFNSLDFPIKRLNCGMEPAVFLFWFFWIDAGTKNSGTCEDMLCARFPCSRNFLLTLLHKWTCIGSVMETVEFWTPNFFLSQNYPKQVQHNDGKKWKINKNSLLVTKKSKCSKKIHFSHFWPSYFYKLRNLENWNFAYW